MKKKFRVVKNFKIVKRSCSLNRYYRVLKYLSTSWIYTPVGKSKTLSFCSDLDQSSHIFYIGTCHVSLVVAKNEILTCSCFVVEIWANVLDRIGSNWIELDQIGSNWIKMDQIKSMKYKMEQIGSKYIKLD